MYEITALLVYAQRKLGIRMSSYSMMSYVLSEPSCTIKTLCVQTVNDSVQAVNGSKCSVRAFVPFTACTH